MSRLVCAAEGAPLASERDALDLIGEAHGANATLVVIPVTRLDDRFFDLSTRIAGEMLQKFTNYGFHVAIVGDISAWTANSGALTDFVRESNKGRSVWFVADMDALEARLDG